MTVYAEMLRMARQEGISAIPGDADPVDHLLGRRSGLDGPGDAATRLARSIAYDVALVELCERLGIEHPMMGPMAGPVARHETELLLSARIPKFDRALRRIRTS